ncbi:thiamine biosynthesis protein ThiF [Candidatus Kaiserbacteria bacterium CG10_big_fil_rev_8_21_14_0_10_59_10]|uniref:Thiamine biosynthesis protein ThiF n=1 Tax=Candidatus Kaiserbacteria bacterium CG10_big_fil_rev_8_21_14_0_10_59_10 TaxID=1974612 RepID=A0A2H0U755_9BACT|nr:MAG: thiamine biosynthesis protein ThiF [Candidatus Kaiserbacteria bacterium CG10_big_fil_rev_8_21_14_0_10_59_10]
MPPERLIRSRETLEEFRLRLQPLRVIDEYETLLEDLFFIRNPRFKFDENHERELEAFIDEYKGKQRLEDLGEWFYFPWNHSLVHYLPEDEHFEIRTARNKNLIVEAEQRSMYNLRVAYAGLSVGSHGALTFGLIGGGKIIHIADPDTLSPSNLNRIRSTFVDIGRKKTALVREQLWELDPYADITSFDDGVSKDSMNDFLDNVDVLVEETDKLDLKILLRLAARERRIPVIMATDNGDNVIADVERFDLEPERPLFHGAIGDVDEHTFSGFPAHHLPKLATKIAGQDFVTERMLASLIEVGKSLYSWPQLGNAATLAGVVIATALKRLACNEPLPSGKFDVSMDAALDPDHSSPHTAKKRAMGRARYLAALGLADESV